MHYTASILHNSISTAGPADVLAVPRRLSILHELRALVPRRDNVTFSEAVIIAELQAAKLLELHEIDDGPVPGEIVTELPKLRIEQTTHAASGASWWDTGRGEWVIHLNRRDSWNRRRFTLVHEFKHIIDHGRRHVLYIGTSFKSPKDQAEQAADYFAGCVLVPRRLLKRAWGQGIQKVADLARLFHVSPAAIEVRLRQTGLVDTPSRYEESEVIRQALGRKVNCCDRGRRSLATEKDEASTSGKEN